MVTMFDVWSLTLGIRGVSNDLSWIVMRSPLHESLKTDSGCTEPVSFTLEAYIACVRGSSICFNACFVTCHSDVRARSRWVRALGGTSGASLEASHRQRLGVVTVGTAIIIAVEPVVTGDAVDRIEVTTVVGAIPSPVPRPRKDRLLAGPCGIVATVGIVVRTAHGVAARRVAL